MSGLIRRLFVAFVLIGLTALACWKLAPRLGMDVPWWVPVTCFAIIVVGTFGIARSEGREPEEDMDGPIPFPTDDGGPEGISKADRDRFG